MGRMEFLFLGLFGAAFLALITYIAALLILGKPPLSGAILPDSPIEDWNDFRSLTFGAAGVVGAVFGLFQLYNAAYRSRLTKEDVAVKDRDVGVKQEAERNDRFVKAPDFSPTRTLRCGWRGFSPWSGSPGKTGRTTPGR